ncbi:RNA-binding domain-containing protein [Phanerochaete sordida]|uniref:RNA-binding domain-containing protein n=1 Tax=Phanerochaete sordida TaxID=48140 RepID=A0A9P3G0E2_9APHY|nr:RNA-binding domain-containing protein [Phanerochaete sordida]
MAASPMRVDAGSTQQQESWDRPDAQQPIAAPPPSNGDAADAANGAAHHSDDKRDVVQPPPDSTAERTGSAAPEAASASASSKDAAHRGEKQIKPNKVYIGGLPEHTRKEDLESCFGKIGSIVNVELKVGYGFVEFDTREAAEESVAKYHEGFFMGNKIRVELSHGGGRTAKYSNDPGACFKCGQVGHWARECPNSTTGDSRRSSAPLIDRIQPSRDYLPPPPPRDYPSYDYARYPPPRDPRYSYDYPPPPGRDFRRPPSPPPRDFRDYPPPAARSGRDVDDYRIRGPPPPPSRYDARPGYYPEPELPPAGYPPRYPPPPPPSRDYYDRYDRRAPASSDRYASYPPPPVRARSPVGPPPPRAREDYDRPPPRDYPPPPAEYRGRPVSPPPARYVDYPRGASVEAPSYRRRSQSPPARSASGAAYDSYAPRTGGPTYNGSSSSYAGNGYSGSAPSRGAATSRDYPPPRSRDSDVGFRRP